MKKKLSILIFFITLLILSACGKITDPGYSPIKITLYNKERSLIVYYRGSDGIDMLQYKAELYRNELVKNNGCINIEETRYIEYPTDYIDDFGNVVYYGSDIRDAGCLNEYYIKINNETYSMYEVLDKKLMSYDHLVALGYPMEKNSIYLQVYYFVKGLNKTIITTDPITGEISSNVQEYRLYYTYQSICVEVMPECYRTDGSSFRINGCPGSYLLILDGQELNDFDVTYKLANNQLDIRDLWKLDYPAIYIDKNSNIFKESDMKYIDMKYIVEGMYINPNVESEWKYID